MTDSQRKKQDARGAAPKKVAVSTWEIARAYVVDASPVLGEKVGNQLLGMFRSRDLKSVTECVTRFPEYLVGSEAWQILRQVAAMFSKNMAFDDPDRCYEAAVENFTVAEKICRITNKRLDWYGVHEERLSPKMRGWIHRMQRDIDHLLGDVGEFESSLDERLTVTSGATQDRSRRRSLPFLKVSGKIRAPSAAYRYIVPLLKFFGVDTAECKFIDVSENRISWVPKNWKTWRGIAAEPTHVLPLQLAAGGFILKKLLRWGVDLRDQTRNQEQARIGSITGLRATIDLRMASDLLAINAVVLLLSRGWYSLLWRLRSVSGRVEGREDLVTYAKFSSMGNGFTFPLETLIFTAACRAVGSKINVVYGDDIVIETELVADLQKLLRFLGFRVNQEKSFSDPECKFRESCGTDWYDGKLVTPYYIREGATHDPVPTQVCHLVNNLLAISVPGGNLWRLCRMYVSSHRLPLVPFNADSMSGIFIDPADARRLGKLYKSTTDNQEEPDYQTPVFRGFGPRPVTRSNSGRRPYFLWHLFSSAEPVTFTIPQDWQPCFAVRQVGELRHSVKDAHLRLAGAGSLSSIVNRAVGVRRGILSETTVRVVYGHIKLPYHGVRTGSPQHMPLVGDYMMRNKRAIAA